MDITGASGFVSYDSILLKHDAPAPRAYVLLHGLTASPLQFAEFGRLLFDRGADVFIPRLPRHGYGDRLTSALEALTADELRAFAVASYARGRELARDVRVVGFSVGGLLAAWIGQFYEVERVTAVAPFFGVSWIPQRFMSRAARFALQVPNQYFWWDPIRRERLMPEHGYPRFPTHAVAVATQVGQEVLVAAAASAPAARNVQVVLNASEAAVNNGAARDLARSWARTTRQRIVLHRVKGLPASHDIIEPLRSSTYARRIYPALLDLVER